MITILAGGTGSVKIIRGIASVENKVNVISNVGDNYWLYGMYICPDIDTVMYGMADLLDTERGWGIKKDTFNFIRQMEIFGEDSWFRIGDRDTATHLIRTNMLKDGKNLTDITRWMCEKFAVNVNIMPVTDNVIETRINTEKGEMHLQEYWVKYRGKDKIIGIDYMGIDKARPNPNVINALHDSELVIIAPANPLTSIGPILQIKGIQKELSKIRKRVVAISPLIGNSAISGPAGDYMKSAGIDVSSYGLARMYSNVCKTIIIDTKDKSLTSKINDLDMDVLHTKIIMNTPSAEQKLASFITKQCI
ncbi:MAG: 2-phospho-L-lactate transferase [Candidatus Nitrosoabyssus spongiisocia]|nr:MAG: 2-phospho-L-lactate transferase [Nitrosopumilaceae archaeon AB1(1)]